MNDRQIAAELHAGSLGALAGLFDAYGDRLFGYCWCMLRSRELAQIALRDTLIVARAHIASLSDPDSLGPWLYFLARAECRRRRPVAPADADEAAARPSQADADSRLMAWHAATSLDPDKLEALELSCRHDVALGPVLGLSADDAGALVNQAREELERALSAEILVNRGSHACPDRADVLAGWAGVMTPDIRSRVLRHAMECPICGPKQPRNVSAARVFALLPAPALPEGARDEVLDFAADESHAAYREFAVNRTAAAAAAGFPIAVAVTPTASEPELAITAAQEPETAYLEAEDATAADLSAPDSTVVDLEAPEPAAAQDTTHEPAAAQDATHEPAAAEPASLEPTAPAAELLAETDLSSRAERLAAAATLLAAAAVTNPKAAATAPPAPRPAAPTSPQPAARPQPAAVPPQPAVPALETLPAAPPQPPPHPNQPQPEDRKTRKPQETRRPQGSPPPPAAPGVKPRRRGSRAGLLVGLAGAMASAAIVGSTLALNTTSATTAARDLNRTVATGSPAGVVVEQQPTSVATGGADVANVPPAQSTPGPSGSRTSSLKPLGSARSVPPPLVSTPGTREETMITLATHPAGRAPAPQPGSPPAGSPSGAAPSSGTLEVAASSLDLGAGSSGQIELRAAHGLVKWSASASPAQTVSLSQSAGTLAAGHSVTLTVTVNRGTAGGSGTVTFTFAGSAAQTIPVTWSAQPSSTGTDTGSGPLTGSGQNTSPGQSTGSGKSTGSGRNTGSGGQTGTGSGRAGRPGTGGTGSSGSNSPVHRHPPATSPSTTPAATSS